MDHPQLIHPDLDDARPSVRAEALLGTSGTERGGLLDGEVLPRSYLFHTHFADCPRNDQLVRLTKRSCADNYLTPASGYSALPLRLRTHVHKRG